MYEAPRTMPEDEKSTEQREREEEKNQRVSRADLSMHAGMGLDVVRGSGTNVVRCWSAGVNDSTSFDLVSCFCRGVSRG